MLQPRVLPTESSARGSNVTADGSPPYIPRVNSWRRSPVRSFTALAAVALLGLASVASAQPAAKPAAPAKPPAAQAALPPAPGAKPAAKKGEAKPEKPLSAEERATRGVVAIERAGQPVGLGVVLSGDGRILTALSPLGAGNDLDVRYADGTSVRVKLGHHDRVWDLALLVPQMGKWTEGLTASSKDPVRPDATIRSFTNKGGKATPVPMVLRSRRTLVGGDDRPLENAIELGSRVSPGDLGSPVVDEEARVVGIVGRGCAPNEGGRPCTPVAYAVPTTAIRNFLRAVPPTAVAPAAWLGIQGVADTGQFAKGVRILMVHPESPADEAQIKGGDKTVSDTVLAVAGVPVTTPEALADAIRTHAVGEKVPLTVFGQGKYRQVTVLLRTAPDAKASEKPAAAAHPAELPPLEGAAPKK